MSSQRSNAGALVTAGILMLFYLAYGLAQPPPMAKARVQRINAVNAAPRLALSFNWSNAPAPAGTPPGIEK